MASPSSVKVSPTSDGNKQVKNKEHVVALPCKMDKK